MLKRRDFLKLAGLAIIGPKILLAKNKNFVTLLDIILPNDRHLLFKGLEGITVRINSIRINDRPLSDYEDIVIKGSSVCWE